METTLISQFEHKDKLLSLYIETHEHPPDATPKETYGILTQYYELSGHPDELTFKQDITHSIKDVDGAAFLLETTDDSATVRYTTILTDWSFDEDGEVKDIIVPDEPYDQGELTLEPGSYRVWEEITGSDE